MLILKKSWSFWKLAWLASLTYSSKHLEMTMTKVLPTDSSPLFRPRKSSAWRKNGQTWLGALPPSNICAVNNIDTNAYSYRCICYRVPQNEVLPQFFVHTVNKTHARVPELENKACPYCIQNNCLCLIMLIKLFWLYHVSTCISFVSNLTHNTTRFSLTNMHSFLIWSYVFICL